MGARRRKNRTHLKGPQKGEAEENVPKSFVIKVSLLPLPAHISAYIPPQSGNVTRSVSQLVRDMRRLMEPHTASRLRERPHARLRDYLTIAPSLAVTHLLAFTLTDATNVHLRMARLPQGPTLTFRVERYSLMRWVGLLARSLAPQGRALNGSQRPRQLVVA
jgi:ribosome biogenesis protein SSF1/2